MLDQVYIDELKAKDKKTAKSELIEYAQSTYGIELKKITRSFDILVEELKSKLEKLADEPMPEENENGLTISDLIEADDVLKGESDFPDEAKNEAIAILKGEIENIAEDVSVVYNHTDNSLDVTFKTKPVVHEVTIDFEIEKQKYELPKDFQPSFQLMGSAPGYYTLPYWINDWIEKTPNWKENIDDCNHHNATNILKTLLYYIQRNGSVVIRESRNSKFITLE